MKLFDLEGHITDEGFRQLIAGELDEMGRLETAEHLDFCDHCVERYSELLTEDLELSPLEEVAPTVMERIRRRAGKIFFNQFTRVSAAAVLAIVIWIGGFYQNGILTPSDEKAEEMGSATRMFQHTVWNLSGGLDRLLLGFNCFLNTPRSEKPAGNMK